MKNALNWFELFVADLDRATRFYETLLGISLKRENFNSTPMAVFPYDGGVGGALVKNTQRKPSADGGLVYLDATDKLDACVERTRKAGGEVVLGRTAIGEHGFIAMVRDSEGNVIGLHSMR
jgi:predicted enzyme related to lactoylglutathione lyase